MSEATKQRNLSKELGVTAVQANKTPRSELSVEHQALYTSLQAVTPLSHSSWTQQQNVDFQDRISRPYPAVWGCPGVRIVKADSFLNVSTN
jgi:hypothetical protein